MQKHYIIIHFGMWSIFVNLIKQKCLINDSLCSIYQEYYSLGKNVMIVFDFIAIKRLLFQVKQLILKYKQKS